MQTKMKTLNYTLIIVIFCLILITLKLINSRSFLMNKVEKQQKCLKGHEKRLKSYVIITLRQSDIIDDYQSSWSALKKDTILLNEIEKLY